jgi:hypothetical protein
MTEKNATPSRNLFRHSGLERILTRQKDSAGDPGGREIYGRRRGDHVGLLLKLRRQIRLRWFSNAPFY